MFYKKIALLLLPLMLLAKPQAPTNLELIPTKHSVLLKWQDNQDDETGFKIYRNDTLIAITKANITDYNDTFLKASTEYRYTVKATDDLVLNQQQREIADKFVSIFENGTQEIQYTYAKNIDDDRGITAGRAGFTSATGDMLEVIKRYTRIYPNNPLKTYIKRLEKIHRIYVHDNYTIDENTTTDSLEGLDGLMSKWHELGRLKSFQAVQDQVVDECYYLPTLELANKELNVTYPLTILALYDTYIQHGEGNIEKIIQETNSLIDNEETCDCREERWYKNFLEIRKTKRDDSIERANALLDLNISNTNNNQLKPLTIHIKEYGEYHYLPKHVYESAEDNTTLGWSFVKGDETTSSITVNFNAEEVNHFIVIKTDALQSQYKLGDWNTTNHKNFSWKLRYNEEFKISIQVQTSLGTRYLVYTPEDDDRGIYEESYIHHGLGTAIQSNSWEYIERNLENDLKEFEPENTLYEIKAFLVQGSGDIDEVASW